MRFRSKSGFFSSCDLFFLSFASVNYLSGENFVSVWILISHVHFFKRGRHRERERERQQITLLPGLKLFFWIIIFLYFTCRNINSTLFMRIYIIFRKTFENFCLSRRRKNWIENRKEIKITKRKRKNRNKIMKSKWKIIRHRFYTSKTKRIDYYINLGK